MYMEKYKPISCTYYDYIEHYAVLKAVVVIQYWNEQHEKSSIESVILDTKNDGTAEYMMVRDLDNPIRMDRIISIDGKLQSDYSACDQ